MNERSQVEIERKYIIKMPDLEVLTLQQDYSRSEILQIYLPSEVGESRRVRRRIYNEKTVYIETRKIRIDNMSSTEIERELSLLEFSVLAAEIKEGTIPIEKVRHTFIYENQLFEIDVFPRWTGTAIMETELDSRERQVEFPAFLEIVREVTGDKAYSNAAMSRSFPNEDKI